MTKRYNSKYYPSIIFYIVLLIFFNVFIYNIYKELYHIYLITGVLVTYAYLDISSSTYSIWLTDKSIIIYNPLLIWKTRRKFDYEKINDVEVSTAKRIPMFIIYLKNGNWKRFGFQLIGYNKLDEIFGILNMHDISTRYV